METLYILSVTRILLLAVWFGTTVMTAAAKPITLRYTFTPNFTTSSPSLHVVLAFQGSATGSSRLILPTTWAGQRDLFDAIHNLKSDDSSTVIKTTDDDGVRMLQYPPTSTVRISYDLVNDWTEPLRHPKEFRVVIQDTHAILNGQNGLIHPEIGQTDQVETTFRWQKLPRNWVVASSFGTGRNNEHFHGEWRVVYNAIFSAGDFRLTRLESGGETLTLAARGSWIFSDRQAADEIQSIFSVERKFWSETKPNRFLVILTPYDQDTGSSDGTVFSDAFLLYLSRNQTFLTDEKAILAHEVFHTWNPYRMGRPAGEATEWFTEGFTRYYQERILLEAGLVTYPEYVARLNKTLTAYWSSPDRNWSQRQWLDREHTGNAESKLPYDRGAMIALWLDQRIRKNSSNQRSLDNRMFALLESPEKQLSTDFLITSLTKDLSPEDTASLRSYVEDGVTISLPTELEPGCGTLAFKNNGNPQYKPSDQVRCREQLKTQRSK
jgi:predicted metalloprotease with PDZ domain